MSDDLGKLTQLAKSGRVSRRDFLGRAAALGIAAPLASQMLGRAARAQEPRRGGNLIMGLNGGASTDSLDPATFAATVAYTFGKCWGETLVETHPEDGSAVPVLAESWEASADAKNWVFRVRKGVTFHDGKEMTVEDVVQTLKRHSDEETKSGALGILRTIGQNFRADGDNLVIELENGNADLPFLLSDYHLMIQPNGGFDAPDAGIGTGPYKVEVNEPGVRHAATRVDGHWREGVGFVDSIEVLVINDDTARISALTTGKVHVINRVSPKTVHLVERAPGVKVNNVAGRGHYVFIMHIDTPPFDNNELRLALKYAMNREAMVETILQGYGTVGNDFPINQAYAFFPDSIPQREYDPERAAHHYKASGHDGTPITLRTSDAAFPGATDAAVLYQQSCEAAGIPIDVKREPSDGYWSNVWNVQPFSTSYWSGRPTQDQMYTVAYHSEADWNDTRWKRPAFDKLLLEARAELDPDRRKELYTEMALMVRDEGGLILPMFNDFIDASTDKLQGQLLDPASDLSNNYIGIRAWLAE
ncbi:MAG TPA: ABC transporter substrate-binding protein [Thermohalobaculum sp.]|nr:ABC transporter substrate-binding protein [Thermohalobaculum sp.]